MIFKVNHAPPQRAAKIRIIDDKMRPFRCGNHRCSCFGFGFGCVARQDCIGKIKPGARCVHDQFCANGNLLPRDPVFDENAISLRARHLRVIECKRLHFQSIGIAQQFDPDTLRMAYPGIVVSRTTNDFVIEIGPGSSRLCAAGEVMRRQSAVAPREHIIQCQSDLDQHGPAAPGPA